MTFIPFSRPGVGESEIAEAVATLRSGWLTTGARVQAFERRFAGYIGSPHAVAVSSGTAALHLSLVVAGIGPGDEVVTTPLTFCATAHAIVHTGATPVFADIDPRTMNLDPDAAEAAVTPRTKAILPVHFAGRPADVDRFEAIARQSGLRLIEDAAHAIESVAAGRKVGTTADLSCFSFYPTKTLTTGEGGMITTGSSAWADRLRILSLQGMSQGAWARYAPGGPAHYDVVAAGYKCNMTDLAAAIGMPQIARLPEALALREAIWRRYDEALADLPVERPAPVAPGSRHARHLYTILVDERRAGLTRDELGAALTARGIGTSVHFRAVHLFDYYASRYALTRGMFPHAEHVSDRTLSLPLSAGLTDVEVDRVIAALRAVLSPAPVRLR